MSHGRIGRVRQQRLRDEPASARQRRLAAGRHMPPLLLARRARRNPLNLLLSAVLSLVIVVVGVFGGLFGLSVVGAAGTYFYFTRDLPSLDQVRTASFETTKIYDRNWNLLYEVADQKTGWRTHITLEEMSPWVTKGTIAVEDATFYDNPGIDVRSIARAVYINLSGIGSSGGSTITMQLVRNVLPLEGAFEVSYTRKVKESILALEFARRYSKDEILEMYLNEVYYGNRAYGIEAAAQVYFGKLAHDLDLAEASLLVGLPQAPSVYDPTQNYKAAQGRQEVVLDNMVKQGYITEAQAAAALQTDLQARLVNRDTRTLRAPHFVNYVMGVLEQRYGAETATRGGLIVQTTLDLPTQEMAQGVVHDHVETLKSRNGTNGALVAIQPWSGQIIAMVGSADYYDTAIDGQVNVATRERQPGSAFKPISYAAAMMKGWSPSTVIIDAMAKYPSIPGSTQCNGVVKTTEKCYIPENFDFKYSGPVSVREALGRSLNIPAVKAIKFAGIAETINLAHAMGIKTGLWRGLDFYGLAITLGGGEVQPLELAAAYATFANGGVHVPTTPFLKVTDGSGRVLEEFSPNRLGGRQVLTPEVAYMMTDVLKDNSARTRTFGAGSVLNLRARPAAAKTGSTTDNRDGWTAGYTTELSVAVWVGNSNNSPTQKLDGVVSAGPIWSKFLTSVYTDDALKAHYADAKTLAGRDGKPLPEDWARPASIVEATVCTIDGRLAPSGVKAIFPRNAAPTRRCGELTPDDMKELQEGLQALRQMPDRFFEDGRSKMYQLSGIARTGTTRPSLPGLAVPTLPAADPLAPTPAPTVVGDGPAGDEDEDEPATTATPGSRPPPAASTPAARPTQAPARVTTVAVPNVFGLSEAEAQRRIRAAGLAVRTVYQRQKDMPPGVSVTIVPVGSVLSATPTYGTAVERGTVIVIAVRARE
ncbi:MAG: transglycosylase domain-containing protein [Chloroflexi bacterium]|nr:transglycosylase domain-containing protein [Chloroflexota bacterium]